MQRRLALVRRPGPRLADGLVTHLERRSIDIGLAQAQWESYVGALRLAGWTCLEVPGADDFPDAVFVEDAAVVYGDLAVIARSGAPERREEPVAVAATLAECGYRIARIEVPGTLDGGDVLKHDGTAYVGVGGRTNGAGVQQLAGHWREFGVRVQSIPVARALHLKSAVTALPDGTVIGWDPVVDDRDAFAAYEGMPEESGAHVVLLGDQHLLMAASAPLTVELLRSRGYAVTTVDISEFEKLEGCVTCLSIRLRG